MGHDVSDIAKPPQKIPCLGCGQRDGLIAPIKDKKAVLFCMRCGTLMDTESTPIDTIVPQLCVHTLAALGHGNSTLDLQREAAAQEAQPKSEDENEEKPAEPAATPLM